MNKYLVKWQERKKLVCLREHESQLSYMFRTPPPSPPPPPPPPPQMRVRHRISVLQKDWKET